MAPGVGHRQKLIERKVRGFVTSFGLWSTWSDLRTGARRDVCHHVAPSPKLCLTRLIFTPVEIKLNLDPNQKFVFLFLFFFFFYTYTFLGIGFEIGFDICFILLSSKILFSFPFSLLRLFVPTF